MFLNPQRIAVTSVYMGVHRAVRQFERIRGGDLEVIDIDDEFQEGDLCWIETPMNPTGESRNIQYYADKVLALRWIRVEIQLIFGSVGPGPRRRRQIDRRFHFWPSAASGTIQVGSRCGDAQR